MALSKPHILKILPKLPSEANTFAHRRRVHAPWMQLVGPRSAAGVNLQDAQPIGNGQFAIGEEATLLRRRFCDCKSQTARLNTSNRIEEASPYIWLYWLCLHSVSCIYLYWPFDFCLEDLSGYHVSNWGLELDVHGAVVLHQHVALVPARNPTASAQQSGPPTQHSTQSYGALTELAFYLEEVNLVSAPNNKGNQPETSLQKLSVIKYITSGNR